MSGYVALIIIDWLACCGGTWWNVFIFCYDEYYTEAGISV